MPTFNLESGVVLDTSKLPAASVEALIARGVGHVFGNETASKIVSAIRKSINPEKPSEVSTDAVKVWRAANADAIAEMTRKAHADFAAALEAGTLGTRESSGPRVDPMTKWMRSRAAEFIVGVLKSKGAIAASERKQPGLDDTFDLGGQKVTFGDLIARRLANPKEGPALQREAKAHFDALARQKAKVEQNAKAASEAESLEDMGL